MSVDAGTSFRNIGEFSDVPPVAVTNAAATSHTITAGKGFVFFMNVGNKIVWYGGSTVDPATSRGAKLLPNSGFAIEQPSQTFKVYFKTASGDTSTIGVVEG
tara:strand:+ start:14388 stop:14693 length:306 start_codon:yes stop_codon:yes gene_type:complete